MIYSIETWEIKCHNYAKKQGFWNDIDKGNIHHLFSKLMLIVTELGEAAEALRNKDLINFREELADVQIRLFDLCGALGIDLEEAVNAKMLYNETRPYMHGKEN